MKLRKLLICGLAIFSMYACQQEVEKLPSGYLFRVVEAKDGPKPTLTDAVKVHLKIELEDSLLIDSREFFPIGRRLAMNNMWPEFKDVLSRVGAGDSVQVIMSLPEYAKLEGRSTPLKDSTLMVTMSLRILDVANEATLIDKMVREQLAYETSLIEEFIVNNNLEAERTPEGVFYLISQQGDGEFIQRDSKVLAHFTLRLLDGTVLSTTNEEIAKANGLHQDTNIYEPYPFMLEEASIDGWLLGMPKFNTGAIGTLIIPSRYAFGDKGANGVIPPNTPVIYDLEIIEIQ